MTRQTTDTSRSAAARGDDDLMSAGPLPQLSVDALIPHAHASQPRADEAGGRWKKEVQHAGQVWSRLTDDDLTKVEAHEKTLADLIRSRYALSPSEVDKQIVAFIKDHQTSSL